MHFYHLSSCSFPNSKVRTSPSNQVRIIFTTKGYQRIESDFMRASCTRLTYARLCCTILLLKLLWRLASRAMGAAGACVGNVFAPPFTVTMTVW